MSLGETICQWDDLLVIISLQTVADLFDYVKSVEKMAALNPMTIYPGHGNVVNRAQTKLDGTLRVKKKESEGILQLLEDIHPRGR